MHGMSGLISALVLEIGRRVAAGQLFGRAIEAIFRCSAYWVLGQLPQYEETRCSPDVGYWRLLAKKRLHETFRYVTVRIVKCLTPENVGMWDEQ